MTTLYSDDLVTLGEAAKILQLSHAAIYKARERDPAGFPDPIVKARTVTLFSFDEIRVYRDRHRA